MPSVAFLTTVLGEMCFILYNGIMKILIATKNRGKFGEIAGVLEEIPGAEVFFLGDIDDDLAVEENGKTHAENAKIKAAHYFEKYGVGVEGHFDFVLGEDSGIYVDALASELGLHTRRWGAGKNATDEEWLAYFLEEMNKRCARGEGRGAKFVCNACLMGDGICEFFDGETLGTITGRSMAPVLGGLPLSSVFMPDGFDVVYSVLSREEKNAISHRGQAVSKVKKFLDGRKFV